MSGPQSTSSAEKNESFRAKFKELRRLFLEEYPKPEQGASKRSGKLDNDQLFHKAIRSGLAAECLATGLPAEEQKKLQQLYELLALAFSERSTTKGAQSSDINNAVEYGAKALDATALTTPEYPARRENLAKYRLSRYQLSGRTQDLENSIKDAQEAANIFQKISPDLASLLNTLGTCLMENYWRSGRCDDLEAARENFLISTSNPGSDSEYPRRLQNLATAFQEMYRFTRKSYDLNIAINMNKVLVQGKDQPAYLKNLALSLKERSNASNNTKDLNDALDKMLEALKIAITMKKVPVQGKDRPACLQNLALSLKERYDASKNPEDLNEALDKILKADKLIAKDGPQYPQCLQNLAVIFTAKYRECKEKNECKAKQYLKCACSCYKKSFMKAEGASHLMWSWTAALDWASLEEKRKSSECLDAYEFAFDLIPVILGIDGPVADRQQTNIQAKIPEVTSDAVRACLKYNNPQRAIEFAERGLAITLQQRLEFNAYNHPLLPMEHASKLGELSFALLRGDSPDPQRTQADREKLLKEIRKKLGLENFLRAKKYQELKNVSEKGPIVILNSHPSACNAILLLDPDSPPRDIPLGENMGACLEEMRKSHTTFGPGRGDIERVSNTNPPKSLQETLHWLQTKIVSKIFAALPKDYTGRLWWCPLGMFTGLPFHAATSEINSTGSHELRDRFIQSYAPSLGILLDARSKTSSSLPKHLLVIAITKTKSGEHAALPSAGKELGTIKKLAKDAKVELDPLLDEKATVEAVSQNIQESSWVHFAGHGKQGKQYHEQSYLQLYDGRLDLQTILKMNLREAEFIYLSACQTAQGDSQLVNESFHLSGGFIGAGFKAAIGTMWTIKDEDGPAVAEVVYDNIFKQDKTSAEALHLAVKKLKDTRNVPPERWVPFIHIGA
ncbi:CHAT domain-containing protein [Mycena maculata]|uniref:CHAT domain-containing protein n=1 Tax=Mycena maculata TaxID=230809 RepID=A0AAD7NN00_9AGAR|nr:CHAT domain-containing protein [Mycena maculata]